MFNYFVLKSGHPLLCVTGGFIELLIIFMTIFKKIKPELNLHLALPYFLIAAIGTSLVY